MSAAVIAIYPSGPRIEQQRKAGRLPKSVGNLHQYRVAVILKAAIEADERKEIERLRRQIAFSEQLTGELRFDLAQILSRDPGLGFGRSTP